MSKKIPPKLRKTKSIDRTIVSTSSSGLPKWKQSPVDLNAIYTWSQKFNPLTINGHWLKDGNAKMTNTGKTVKIEFTERSLPSISGGPLKDIYEFENLQFRWGPGNSRGAEHSINNLWYSMEAQAIHWNTKYDSIDKCYDKSDGIAILSFLLQVVGFPESPDNPSLANITEFLHNIRTPGSSVSIASDCMAGILEACLNTKGYYTYSGSLTTKPYNECVTWIVVPRPIEISAKQAAMFRKICDNNLNNIVRNYRSQQSLNGRRIFYATDSTSDVIGLMKTGGSPINLDDEIVKVKQFPALIINGHWLKDGEAILSNNGETAMIHLTGNRIPSTVTGGPLMTDVYEFDNAHFHWGEDNSTGSEHQINSTWFSMESHVVHWNRKYKTFNECLNHKDGLCILTYLFLVSEKYTIDTNPMFDKITENLKHVHQPEKEIIIPANALCWMRDATHCPSYYSYPGSYNKGSFPECATWIVFPLIIPISASQVQEFRKLLNEEGFPILQNRRAIQAFNGRRIFKAAYTT